jgi:hypothetical protein
LSVFSGEEAEADPALALPLEAQVEGVPHDAPVKGEAAFIVLEALGVLPGGDLSVHLGGLRQHQT